VTLALFVSAVDKSDDVVDRLANASIIFRFAQNSWLYDSAILVCLTVNLIKKEALSDLIKWIIFLPYFPNLGLIF
jgi:hypothetical protein